MKLVKKMAFPLILIGGLTQQTFCYFEKFQKVMSENIHNSPVATGALAGAVLGTIICKSNNKFFSDALSIKKQVKKEIEKDNSTSYDNFLKKWRPQDINMQSDKAILDYNGLHTSVSGSILTRRVYSWTQDRICKSQFEAEILAQSDDHTSSISIENLKVTNQESSFARSWPRTFAVVGLFTGIGGLIGYQFKKN